MCVTSMMHLTHDEWLLVLAPPIGYALFLSALWPLRTRPLRVLGKLRVAYNLCMAVYSLCVVAAVLSKLVHNGRFASAHALLCEASPGVPLGWYLSKYAEWMDTLFIVNGGRWPSGLHTRHHATAASVVALNLVGRATPTPMFDVGTLLNAAGAHRPSPHARTHTIPFALCCAVHTVMYAYYAAPRALARFKRAITVVQLLQHTLVLGSICTGLAWTPDCDAPAAPLGASIVLYTVFLLDFTAFYVQAYPPTSHTKVV